MPPSSSITFHQGTGSEREYADVYEPPSLYNPQYYQPPLNNSKAANHNNNNMKHTNRRRTQSLETFSTFSMANQQQQQAQSAQLPVINKHRSQSADFVSKAEALTTTATVAPLPAATTNNNNNNSNNKTRRRRSSLNAASSEQRRATGALRALMLLRNNNTNNNKATNNKVNNTTKTTNTEAPTPKPKPPGGKFQRRQSLPNRFTIKAPTSRRLSAESALRPQSAVRPVESPLTLANQAPNNTINQTAQQSPRGRARVAPYVLPPTHKQTPLGNSKRSGTPSQQRRPPGRWRVDSYDGAY